MKFYKPLSLDQALDILISSPDNRLLLAGGSDINIILRQNNVSFPQIIMINHLSELKGINIVNNKLIIGATTTISEIANNKLIKKNCPFLADSLTDFASPQIANIATIAGNIANSSPTADSVPLLLVLRAALEIRSKSGFRIIPISNFYTGYKKNVLSPQELIYAIHIPLQPQIEYTARYIKVGSRTALSIAKLSLALIKDAIGFRIAAGSLNEYPRRLIHVEEYLTGSNGKFLTEKLKNTLIKDVTPITDFRSDADYRLNVCYNYLTSFLDSIYSP